jgi:hypothetical protein
VTSDPKYAFLAAIERDHGRQLRRYLAVRMRNAAADLPDLVYSRAETSLRSKVLFKPSDNWRITLAGDYSFASDDVGVAKQPFRGTIVQGGSTAPASIWDVAEIGDTQLFRPGCRHDSAADFSHGP